MSVGEGHGGGEEGVYVCTYVGERAARVHLFVRVTPDQACFHERRLSASQGCVSISPVHSRLAVSEI